MSGPRRGRYWTAVAFALALILGGAVVAFIGYERSSGPDGAVKAYFAALSRSDAPAALAFGDIPDGPRTLLTSTVLREQQRIAPITDVQVNVTQQHGSRATVSVHYDLGFADGRLRIDDQVDVVRRGHTWHLTTVAADTRLDLLQAADRATIVGAAVPQDHELVFPGAAPIRLDTPLLAIESDTSVITLSGTTDTTIGVSVSSAGRDAARAALTTALRSCLTQGSQADPRCPLPSARVVPGSVRATVPADLADAVGVVVQSDPAGALQLSGSLHLNGQYTALDFNNVASVHRGPFTLPITALAYPRTPLTLQWQQPGTT